MTLRREIRIVALLASTGLLAACQSEPAAETEPVAAIPDMRELNIGHSIISRAIMVGLEQAVRDMKRLMLEAVR